MTSPVLVNISVGQCNPFPALLFDGRVIALAYWRAAGIRGTATMADLLDDWAANTVMLESLCAAPETKTFIAERGESLATFELHAPVVPRHVYCTIANYCCQVLQAASDAGDGPQGVEAASRREAALASIEVRRASGAPYVCLKAAAAVSGPHTPLRVEEGESTLDWEAEIGVVIGRPARNIDPAHALEYVAGYCVVNDITLRARVFRQDTPMGTDWLQSKSREGWLPTGPWLVPEWSVPDPSALRPWLRLNGTLMQDGAASEMIFGVARQIAYVSTQTTLQPGDLICTGTPAGIGSHHGRYLRPGDVVEAGVHGLGQQRVVCLA